VIRKAFFWLLLAALVALWAFADDLFPPERVTADTATVRDGDTLIVAGKTYRLYGIDAPEYRQTCTDKAGLDWPCGKAARLQLATHVASGSIVCEPRAEDLYGRKVAKCASATVPDLAAAMVEAGLAISPAERGTAAYDEQQDSARAAARGIWQGQFTTPAEWREDNPRKDTQ
jgi:endonuclease YncB( thermonuclease family)